MTKQQLLNICNLQQSSLQAEEALSQGLEALQLSLSDTLSGGSLGSSSNVSNYMDQMAGAMTKLGTYEAFVHRVRLLLMLLSELSFVLPSVESAVISCLIHMLAYQ